MADVNGLGTGIYNNEIGPTIQSPLARRCRELEKLLEAERKDYNGAIALANALASVVEQGAPDHPLAQRDNRLKVYEANRRLDS